MGVSIAVWALVVVLVMPGGDAWGLGRPAVRRTPGRGQELSWALAAKGKAAGGGFGKPKAEPKKPKGKESRMPEDLGEPCGCFSGKAYADCCHPFHSGAKDAPDVMALMRARYSAFRFRDIGFIVDSTHPENSLYGPREEMMGRLDENCYDDFDFLGLTLPNESEVVYDGADAASVEYKLDLRVKSNGMAAGFAEAANFKRKDGRWLYVEGNIRAYAGGEGPGGMQMRNAKA